MNRAVSGFTLIELLIVIAIIGILSSVLIPGLLQSRAKANDQATMAYLRHCMSGVEISRDPQGALPAGLNGQPCNSPVLGTAAQLEPSSIRSGSSHIDLSDQTVAITATSASGKSFCFDGSGFKEGTSANGACTAQIPNPN